MRAGHGRGAEAHNVTARRCSSVYAMSDRGPPASAGSATLILECAPLQRIGANDPRCTETVI